MYNNRRASRNVNMEFDHFFLEIYSIYGTVYAQCAYFAIDIRAYTITPSVIQERVVTPAQRPLAKPDSGRAVHDGRIASQSAVLPAGCRKATEA